MPSVFCIVTSFLGEGRFKTFVYSDVLWREIKFSLYFKGFV
jgi:hypothetical protein